MSFAAEVKEEISREVSNSAHCRIAEIAAVLCMSGRIIFDEDDKISIKIQTENVTVARKYFTLIKKTFNINAYVLNRRVQNLNRSHIYVLQVQNDADARKILTECRLLDESGELIGDTITSVGELVRRECCKRAFIRGAFLAAGSVNDPKKSYHYEIVCADDGRAQQISGLMAGFGIQARIIFRKGHYVVYVKDSSQVVDLLNIMGAHSALMAMENVLIVKDVRNSVNRKVNCEMANINKTVNASVKQIDDIRFIQSVGMYDRMSDGLRQMAEVRIKYPSASLAELGEYLDPPLGKAGVNHRLKKISLLAEEIRQKQAELK